MLKILNGIAIITKESYLFLVEDINAPCDHSLQVRQTRMIQKKMKSRFTFS